MGILFYAGVVTPAAKPASHDTHAASWAFTESFVPESELAVRARKASAELGVTPVTPGGAALLSFVAALIGARAAVEIGTGAGVSGLALLAGMQPDGILTSIDLEPEHQASARATFAAGGIATRRARLIAGSALTVLPKLSDAAYDLVLVDGDPLEYVEYVAQAARLLRPGGVLVINHALAGGGVADPANEDDDTVIIREALQATQEMEEFAAILVPVGDGLALARRV